MAEDVSHWTCEHVGEWLDLEIKHEGLKEAFKKECIDGEALLLLNEQDLHDSRFTHIPLGVLKKLRAAVQRIKYDRGDMVTGGPCEEAATQTLRHRPRLDSFNSTEDDTSLSSALAYPQRPIRPEYNRLFLSILYCFFVFLVTACTMVLVHDRVPDMQKWPPLPDLLLDTLPYMPWAFQLCEVTAMMLGLTFFGILVLHKYRAVIWRRFNVLMGTMFLLRCVTMLITSLSVPGTHLECKPLNNTSLSDKMDRAMHIWAGAGMSLVGVRTCGDYMFSGHTVVVTMLNMFITEYSPHHFHMLHTISWVMNLFAIFFILGGHEHYSIDVFIAFYITSRLFLYYHSLANNRALRQADRKRTQYWFPMFSYFEAKVDGIVPNEFEHPSVWLTWSKNWLTMLLMSVHVKFKAA